MKAWNNGWQVFWPENLFKLWITCDYQKSLPEISFFRYVIFELSKSYVLARDGCSIRNFFITEVISNDCDCRLRCWICRRLHCWDGWLCGTLRGQCHNRWIVDGCRCSFHSTIKWCSKFAYTSKNKQQLQNLKKQAFGDKPPFFTT